MMWILILLLILIAAGAGYFVFTTPLTAVPNPSNHILNPNDVSPQTLTTAVPRNGYIVGIGGLVNLHRFFVIDMDESHIEYHDVKNNVTAALTVGSEEVENFLTLAADALSEDVANFPPLADVNFYINHYSNGQIVATAQTYGPLINDSALEKLWNDLSRHVPANRIPAELTQQLTMVPNPTNVAVDTEETATTREYYSVTWPEDWSTNDLTANSLATGGYSGIASFVGGRPEGQVTFFQHAIFVSTAAVETIKQEIENGELDSNGELSERSPFSLSGLEGERLEFQNQNDNNNKTTYYVLSDSVYVYVIQVHGPSDATYLNEAASTLLNSFKIQS